ncbi:MAG: thioredoxin family protein, partial [Chitinophagaceae bacterium]|nr:thioredoxin family protein [Chitinophagaceae bacterium]
ETGYTTWCGPCKVMSKNIFPQKAVGDFFNEKFINVKVQFDQTNEDNEEIKKWYTDAAAIGKEYNVLAYPTFLYFSPEGKLVHLYVGSTNTAEEFVDASSKALDPSTQYYVKLQKMVEEAKGDPEALRKLVQEAQEQYDGINSAKLAEMYLRTQKNLLTKDNLTLLNEFTKKSTDFGFDVFVNQTEKVNALMGKGFAQQKFIGIIYEEAGAMKWLSSRTDSAFAEVSQKLYDKYPAHAEALLARLKLTVLQISDPKGFLKQVGSFVKKYNKDIYPQELNSFATYVCYRNSDPAMWKQALNWSDQICKENPSADFLSVRSSLLYQLGKKGEAIALQKQVIAILEKEEKKYQVKTQQDLLARMEKGEKL